MGGFQGIWMSGYLDICNFGYLNILIFGYLDIWISGIFDIGIMLKNQFVVASPIRTTVWCSPAGGFCPQKKQVPGVLQPKTVLFQFYLNNL